MRKTVNVRPLISVYDRKKYNVNKRKNVRLLEPFAGLKPGEQTFRGKLGDHLLNTGKAVEVKEEKAIYETKEEKYAPEVTKLSVKKLTEVASNLSLEDLEILLTDERITARKLAEEELSKR